MGKTILRMNKTIFSFFLLAAASSLFAGCGRKGEDNILLKPISENVIGKWQQTRQYQVRDGKTEEIPFKENEGFCITFRADSTALLQATAPPQGQTFLRTVKWHADDKTETLSAGSPLRILRLDAENLEASSQQSYDMEDSTRLQGEFRWHFVRMDASERNLAEKLSSGRWLLAATFEKQEGAWAEIRSNVPDEAWREFRQDGIACSFCKEGGKVEQTESEWSVNLSTGELRIYQDAANWHSSTVEFENDSTLAIFCSGNAPGPGNVPLPAGTPGAKERKELYTLLHK